MLRLIHRHDILAAVILLFFPLLLFGSVTLGPATLLPVFDLAVTLATGGRGQHIAQAVGASVDQRLGQAGFRLQAIHVQGASELAKPDIVEAAGVAAGAPLLGLDLEAVRQRVERVGWVEEARIVRLLPDTLVIAIKERRQLAVWQHNGRTFVIDETGRIIPEANPARFTRLPLVVGAGGALRAGEILPTLAQRPKLMARMEALVRVDDRRWDLRLKDGSLIQLPAAGEEQALMQLEQLDLRSRILDLGFERIRIAPMDESYHRVRSSCRVLVPGSTIGLSPNASYSVAARSGKLLL